MKKLPVVLFLSGMAIQFSAMLGEHAADIPFVLRIVAPSYYRAQNGVETLLEKRKLVSTDQGFDEIARFLIWNVYEINHMAKNRPTDHKVEWILCMGETRQESTSQGDILFTPDDVRYSLSSVTNRFVDSAGKISSSLEFHYQLGALKKNVEGLKETTILGLCFGIFFIGCAVELVAFYLEHAETKKTEAIAYHHKNNSEDSDKKENAKQPAS